MKKALLFFWIIALGSALIFTGCAKPAPAPAPAPAPVPAPAKPIELKWAFHMPPMAWPVPNMFKPWAKRIEEESGGRVKITLFPSASLVKMRDEYDAVESGLADIATFSPEITPGRFPRSEISTLPKLFPSAEVTGRAFHELLEKYAVDTELSRVKLFWLFAMPPMQMHGTKPVHTLEDFKGKKIRIEGKVEGWVVEALGATGVTMDLAEIYTSLERGLVDEFFFLWEGVIAFGLKDVSQYRTKCDMFTRAQPTVMNWDTWNSLPADIQEIFNKHSGIEFSAQSGAAFDEAEAGFMGIVTDYDKKVGNPAIYILPEDENARWQAAVSPVWDKWASEKEAEGVPARAMLDGAVSLIEQYSR